jgi:hypothetical protein
MPHDGVIRPHPHDHHHHHDDAASDHRAPTRRAVLAAGAGLLVSQIPVPAEAQIVERMARAAVDWLAALDEPQRARAVIAFDDGERENWHYVPRSRRGLALRDMSESQRARAMALLESGLGGGGIARVEGVRRLEDVLRQRQGAWRDPDNYALTVFGAPGTYPWGWRFEGHHLSLNVAAMAPDRIAVTPTFWGAHPARAPDGFRLMGAVEDLGHELVRGLSEPLRRAAVIGDRSLGDIVAGPGRERDLGAPRGLALADMDAPARNRALAIIGGFLDVLAPDVAAVQRRRVQDTGAANLRFAWAGPLDDGRAYYFRLHGTATLIELDNSQNDANHVHSVWRDLAGDFGRDVLAEHYRRQQHQ